MKAWYFSDYDCRLRHGDGRKIKPGVTHKFDGKPVLCERGLHASIRPLDAIRYAPGPVVWRVELGGDIVRDDDKLVATKRTYLWGYDASKVLRHFARLCALDVIHLWDAPEVVIRYLKTGDNSMKAAAWAGTWDAAWAGTWDATWAAAWDATWAAAWAAARDAAWAAAGDAAWAAARAASRAASREQQNKRLYRMLMAGRPGEKP